jgi:hypothetical protein
VRVVVVRVGINQHIYHVNMHCLERRLDAPISPAPSLSACVPKNSDIADTIHVTLDNSESV